MLKIVYFALSLTALLLGGCHEVETTEHEDVAKFKVTTPIRRDTSIVKEYVSQIHAIRHIEIRALERGYLQSIYVDEGQQVNQGQMMFKIMPNIYQADLQKAKAEADMSLIEYKNTQALADKNIVSLNELELSKAKLNKASAEVKAAETHLGFTNISAPFTGIMDHLEVRNGSLIDEGDLLTTLSDVSKMWVYFNVPESEYIDYMKNKKNREHEKVKLKMANGDIFDQEGVVEAIEADFDNKTGNIQFRATVPNPDKILRHGQTGNVLMTVPYKNAMLIPQNSTFEILDKTYVYVVSKDNKLEQRLIQIDAELPHLFIVKSGIQDGERILIDGLRKVQNGQVIKANFIQPEQAVSDLSLYAE
ncbi:efflux RND transporter periplasmic adaptor subunit [Methylobacillus gramineus]|uniref:efflux RND transporter periplasmic adaptor subunit n=1 Tax=Methylobacillus gramineus TaxID=755169 RepID=UPI001CFFD4FD|nr:efflux RND transporter periplasmic adaptor subunit [Methylobacillus gramineus]MCB5183959.1 efflux RND transporter periplasmic adaptor subunit [Methylobacillus gramineus]